MEVLGWIAIADAIAGTLLALAVYVTGNRSGRPVTRVQTIGLGIMFGLPATLLYLIALCVCHLDLASS
jgi:hypothetical protein